MDLGKATPKRLEKIATLRSVRCACSTLCSSYFFETNKQVQIPHPGTSYNPDKGYHRQLLEASIKEQLEIRRQIAEIRRKLKRAQNATVFVSLCHFCVHFQEMVIDDPDEAESVEDEGDDISDVPKVNVAFVQRKTRAQRNKEARKRARELEEISKAKKLRLKEEERKLEIYIKEAEEEVKKLEAEAKEKELSAKSKQKIVKTPQLGPEKYPQFFDSFV